MSKLVEANEKIAEAVVAGYKTQAETKLEEMKRLDGYVQKSGMAQNFYYRLMAAGVRIFAPMMQIGKNCGIMTPV